MKTTRNKNTSTHRTGIAAPRTPLIIPERAAARAALNFTRSDAGCDISNYSVGSHGYAQIGWCESSDLRRTTTVHRAAWVYHTGAQIPEGMTVDHICKNRRCVRFEHLRLLTNFENARRTMGRDWPLGQCVNGHPNKYLYQQKSGRWVCGGCRQMRAKVYASRKKF